MAINGGKPEVDPDLTFHKWPPVDAQDEALVLEALRQPIHSSGGPHVHQLEAEFAAWNGNRHVIAHLLWGCGPCICA